MKYRRRIYYSAAQRAEIWDRWQRGESMSSIGRLFDRQSSSVFSMISPTAGIRPPDRKRGKQALSLAEREEISRGLSIERSLRGIARHLGRAPSTISSAPSTISREVHRNVGRAAYRAAASDQAAWARALRPKMCKLSCHRSLSCAVSAKLRRKWSPEQIAGWLIRTYQGEAHKQVSHETIYRSLYIQARGVLKKEFMEHLRAKRTVRRSRHASLKRNGLVQVKGVISISERPASVEDRAVPDHWEVDVALAFLKALLAHEDVRPLLSDEHFSVDGTLIEAWDSSKSFRPVNSSGEGPDGGDGRNQEAGDAPTRRRRNTDHDLHHERRSNKTHRSTTDPDARLYKKSPGKEAKICFMGHACMDSSHGLIVDAALTLADGHGERHGALHMIEPRGDRPKPITLGADKGYNMPDFVNELRSMNVRTHVAAKAKHSAIDKRTTRHESYRTSQRNSLDVRPHTDAAKRGDQELYPSFPNR